LCTGRVHVSVLPYVKASFASRSCSCSLSCSTSTRPIPSLAPRSRDVCRLIRFKMAALRSRFRPSAFCFAHTAILEFPLSTMLVAGWENWGESRDVIRKSRSRLFFLYVHECSPSMSATARHRFFDRGGDGRWGNVRAILGCGDIRKVNSEWFVCRNGIMEVVSCVDVGVVFEEDDGVILRRATFFVF